MQPGNVFSLLFFLVRVAFGVGNSRICSLGGTHDGVTYSMYIVGYVRYVGAGEKRTTIKGPCTSLSI